jgi:hypothetical protein
MKVWNEAKAEGKKKDRKEGTKEKVRNKDMLSSKSV